MKVADGLVMLEIAAIVMGKEDVIHPAFLWDDRSAVLVDTGYPGQWPLIRDAILKANVPLEKLSHIIVTHQDLDHIGSLPVILQDAKQRIEVLASSAEKPFIEGERKLLKISEEAIEKAVAALPASVPEQMRSAFRAVLTNPPKACVDRAIGDGEHLPFCGGIAVIGTPGHTPGHTSLYHMRSKTLIAADALTVENGQLLGPNPATTLDMEEALESLRRLARFEIENVICYHGGLYRGDANRRIAELAL